MSFMDLPPEEDLLAEQAALRRMAAGLVRDDSTADDLVQEAWVAAAESPNRIENLRAWMRQVLRHFAGQLHRKRERDRHYERAAAQGESLEPVDEELSREQLFEELASALSRLREPLRTVVYLRFYEGLGPKAIAERLGRPTDTVKSQLKRGIEELRGTLERRLGKNWAPGLVVLAAGRGAEVVRLRSPATGWFAQPLTWASLVLVGVALWVFGTGAGLSGRVPDVEVVTATEAAPRDEPAIVDAQAEERAAPSAPLPAAESETAEPAAAGTAVAEPEAGAPAELAFDIDVRVVDERGVAVSGAPVAFQASGGFEVLGESDADGRLSVRLPRRFTGPSELFPDHERSAVVRVQMPGRVTLCEKRLGLRKGPPLSVELPVGGPCATVRGVVTDPDGAPVAGAAHLLYGYEASIEFVPEGEHVYRSTYECRGVSDAEGRFELRFLAPGKWYVELRHPEFANARREFSVEPGEVLDLRLELDAGSALEGVVRGEGGAPVADALVYCYEVETAQFTRTRSGPDGSYRLAGIPAGFGRYWARTADAADGLDFTELVVPDGEVAAWDPQLTRRPGLRMRLVTPDGEPVVHGFVIAAARRGASAWVRREYSDERGEVHIPDCPGWDMEVYVLTSLRRGSLPKVHLRDVRPSDEVRVVEVPDEKAPTGFTGLVAGQDGRPLTGATLGYRRQESELVTRAELSPAGGFLIDDVIAGTYVLTADFDAGGIVVLDQECVVEPGVVVDLGEMRVPARALLELEWSWPEDEGLEWQLHVLTPRPGALHHRLMQSGPSPPPASLDLHPGNYTIDVLRGGVRLARFPFEHTGVGTRLSVQR